MPLVRTLSVFYIEFWRGTPLTILPQALRTSIPGIVSSFIELFKNTSLVAIIGLLDLFNMAQSASRPQQLCYPPRSWFPHGEPQPLRPHTR